MRCMSSSRCLHPEPMRYISNLLRRTNAWVSVEDICKIWRGLLTVYQSEVFVYICMVNKLKTVEQSLQCASNHRTGNIFKLNPPNEIRKTHESFRRCGRTLIPDTFRKIVLMSKHRGLIRIELRGGKGEVARTAIIAGYTETPNRIIKVHLSNPCGLMLIVSLI